MLSCKRDTCSKKQTMHIYICSECVVMTVSFGRLGNQLSESNSNMACSTYASGWEVPRTVGKGFLGLGWMWDFEDAMQDARQCVYGVGPGGEFVRSRQIGQRLFSG